MVTNLPEQLWEIMVLTKGEKIRWHTGKGVPLWRVNVKKKSSPMISTNKNIRTTATVQSSIKNDFLKSKVALPRNCSHH